MPFIWQHDVMHEDGTPYGASEMALIQSFEGKEMRADVVGSLLRPSWLLAARAKHEAGELSATDLRSVEDRAVDEAIALQESVGLQVLSDGEMRRLSFQAQLPAAVEGFGDFHLDAFLWGDWRGDAAVGDQNLPRPSRLGVTQLLRRRSFPSVEEFTYLRSHTDCIPKISLPSPSLWANFWSEDSGPYPTLEAFLGDVAYLLREEVAQLVGLGATYIQLDAPHYPLISDPSTRGFYESRGWTVERWLDMGADLDNAVISGHGSEVTFAVHMCRGNQESRWLAEGDYEMLATRLLPRLKVGRFLMEYDDLRSGSFEPLRHLGDDRHVVLGLVTTKTGRLENTHELVTRVREASRHVPLDQLAVSPQCGFASSVRGNRLSHEEQRQKLELVVRVAEEVWG